METGESWTHVTWHESKFGQQQQWHEHNNKNRRTNTGACESFCRSIAASAHGEDGIVWTEGCNWENHWQQ